MKRLLVLWDPENPATPVGSVVSALREKVDLHQVTFRDVSHRTLPNRAFEIRRRIEEAHADALLWIEGGPLPRDLDALACPKACWLVNSHHEPSLIDDLGQAFDVRYTTVLDQTRDERFRFLPLAAGTGDPPLSKEGVTLLVDDPRPPSHARIVGALREALDEVGSFACRMAFLMGQGSQYHPMFFDCLRLGIPVVAHSGGESRGLFHPGEHADILPEPADLADYLRGLIGDQERLSRLSSRGPEIVSHLHTPDLRAAQIVDGIWPRHRAWGCRDSTPQISVLVTCHRYLRRLRICLESLARQEMAPGTIEVVVADPESPDGIAQFLPDFALRNPQLRVVHLPLDARYYRNRGLGINRAFDASRGEVIISIDGDIVFPPGMIATLADQVRRSPQEVFGVRRVFLPRETTEAILRGEIDPVLRFDELRQSDGDGEEHPFVGVLGYCQAVHRSAVARARYPEEFDKVNQSDIVFVERLGRWAGIRPRFLPELAVLHLWHPRNWSGTQDFL